MFHKPSNFLKNFSVIVDQSLPDHARGKPLEIWFQDEARVGQQGSLTRIWAKKGTRPRQIKDQRFSYGYIFGAVCPERDIGAAIVVPYANTDAMNKHLLEISLHIQENHHGIIIMDGAGWHKSDELKVPKNITLIMLPPYSPELNPVENIWQYLKNNFLNNITFKNYDAIVDACCSAWNKLIKETGRINSISSREWARRGQ